MHLLIAAASLWRWAARKRRRKKCVSPGGGETPDSANRSGRLLACPGSPPGAVSPKGGDFATNFAQDWDRAARGHSRCPLAHGSVGVDPYPGYVHGRRPSICKYGCRPEKRLGAGETPRQTLIREAMEYQELYHREAGSTLQVKEARIAQVLAEIRARGTYELTFDELQHGARVAWRNAPKCSNRAHWSELVLLDYRGAATNEEMFRCCLEYLETAMRTRATVPYIAAFRPARVGTNRGPRIWNGQLHKFCAYMTDEGRVVGDPAELAFTEFLETELGWKAPEKRGEFDIQPLVLQMDPGEPPEVFEIPPSYVEVVNIQHPEHEGFQELGLKWYGIPFVSDIELSVGGITFTAAPFNGWYADTEIARDLADEGRYNKLPAVAEALGMDTRSNGSMWRDGAMYELCRAVFHSFGEAKVGLVDHHTLMQNFHEWYHAELATRGYAPGNWKWIISPMSASASPCYLGLRKMTEYTLKPAYTRGPGWRTYSLMLGEPLQCGRTAANLLANWALARMLGRVVAKVRSLRPSLAILYASVSGNTRRYAHRMRHMVRDFMSVALVNLADFDPNLIEASQLCVVMTSTYGSGAPPQAAKTLLSWLSKPTSRAAVSGRPFSVLGFGDSTYPRFCAAAESVVSHVERLGGRSIVPLRKADASDGEEATFLQWVKQVILWCMANTKISHGAVRDCLPYILEQAVVIPRAIQAPFRIVRWQHTPSERPAPLARVGSMALGQPRRHFADVISVAEVCGKGDPGRATVLAALDISACANLKYCAGDYIQIFPKTKVTPAVTAFAAALGIDDLDDVFDVEPAGRHASRLPVPTKFVTALTEHLDLNSKLTQEAVLTIVSAVAAAGGATGEDWALLRRLEADEEKLGRWLDEHYARWVDMFVHFPCLSGRLPLALAFHLMPLIRPRTYSVASSHRFMEGREVHCLVQRLHYTLPVDVQRAGLCSNYVGDMQVGEKVAFAFHNLPQFRLPINPQAPILLLGAGTGIAPFRGFLQERTYLQRFGPLGPAILMHGCRKRADLLFEEEIMAALDASVLTDFYVAYSRELGVPKTHVQDLLKANGGRLRAYLRDPCAHIYICGAVRLSVSVSQALHDIVGGELMGAMVEEERYHEDVFSLGAGG